MVAFAEHDPQSVVETLSQCGLDSGSSRAFDIVDRAPILEGLRKLLHHLEVPSGTFPITRSFLRLMNLVVAYLQRWTLGEDQLASPRGGEFSQAISYIQREILSEYTGWRYQTASERSKVGSAILDMLRQVRELSSPPVAFIMMIPPCSFDL